MKTWGTKEFIDYCYLHWIKKKDTKEMLKLLEEYALSSLAVTGRFSLHWMITLENKQVTSKLHKWKVFRKVKPILNRKFIYLNNNKW